MKKELGGISFVRTMLQYESKFIKPNDKYNVEKINFRKKNISI